MKCCFTILEIVTDIYNAQNYLHNVKSNLIPWLLYERQLTFFFFFTAEQKCCDLGARGLTQSFIASPVCHRQLPVITPIPPSVTVTAAVASVTTTAASIKDVLYLL